MSELDGYDAFNRVLDKLLEGQEEVIKANKRAYDAETMLRDAGQKLEAMRNENTRLKREDGKALPILKELYEAAEALAKYAQDSASPGLASAAERVLKSLNPAGIYCDQEIRF